MRQKIILASAVLLFCFASCQPDPATTHDKAQYIQPILGERTSSLLDLDGGTLRCPTPGTNCFLFIQEGDPPPVYNRNMLNTLYDAYAEDTLAGFFEKNDWRAVFPSSSAIDTIAAGKIANGTFGMKVLSDSSVVILSTSLVRGVNDSDIIFALFRNDKYQ